MPATNTITAFYSFTASTPNAPKRIKSAEVNTNFATFRGHIIPVDPNTTTAAAAHTYNLGGYGHEWNEAHVNYLLVKANGVAPSVSTTTSIALYSDGSGNVFKIFSSGTITRMLDALSHEVTFGTISALTEDTSPDTASDFIPTYDISAAGPKKLSPNNLVQACRATQTEMEGAAAANRVVTPGAQHWHASASKAWVKFTSVGTTAISVSYNITSLTDNGTGVTTISIATDFSSANYCSVATSNSNTSAVGCLCIVGDGAVKAAGTLQVYTITPSTLGLADASDVNVAMFGDQA